MNNFMTPKAVRRWVIDAVKDGWKPDKVVRHPRIQSEWIVTLKKDGWMATAVSRPEREWVMGNKLREIAYVTVRAPNNEGVPVEETYDFNLLQEQVPIHRALLRRRVPEYLGGRT